MRLLSILGLIAIGPAFDTPARAAQIFQIPNTAGHIVIDGRLDDAAWEEALELELAYETEPGENVEPPVRTSCRMIFSHTHLYYSCTAYDPEPHRIRARYTGRDQALDDDTIGLAIDTFNDHNTAFVLDVNPLGVQNDRLYIEATGASDSTWDAVWDSAGRLTDFGFEVEAAIPFSSLRFPRTTGRQTWGFNFRRYQTRDAYRRIALVPLDRNDRCRTCQHALLVGFENIDPGHNLEITPTITSLRTATREDFPDGPLAAADPDVEPGLTVNWGVTPNFTLASALNPDFSQVEADVAQLDINTSFALFFPERRPFFLEGSDYFSTQLRAVYTRSVADPDWGLKLTGKEGRHAVGISVARDAITTLLLPGPESSALDSLDRESTAAVLRYRRDLTESSTFGALVTDR
ncbi:MAG: carbohydrate binding family 9 domain-containing protein, partial [Acidobacteriota bacterium]|nr:carbohydrate binding family 9 domain-containing protein [Acidobacteriota bacterium]